MTRARLALTLATLVVGCGAVAGPQAAPSAIVEVPAGSGEPIRALPQSVPGDPARVALGRDLFFEPALSGDGTLRCADCHVFDRGGADPRGGSVGVGGQVLALNAPSIFNLAFDHCLDWDGRTCDIFVHARFPLLNPRVMGTTEEALLAALAATKDYAARFAAAYPDGLTLAGVAHALGEYQRTLVTPNARFDRWLRGEAAAISADELAGYRTFKELGCASCHQGTNVGGNLFQRFGVLSDVPGHEVDDHPGRYLVTHREEDRGLFRVPSLRNAALTAPYFHDGSAPTLDDAVRIMGRHQLGQELEAEQVAAIVAFLGTLTGEAPEAPDGG